LEARHEALRQSGAGTLAAAEAIDLTFPGRRPPRGHPHPVMRVWREIEDIFRGLGYDIARGPEVDTDYYSFEALNMPPGHPARSGFDTFFIGGATSDSEAGRQAAQLLLRPHTSPMQIRYMESHPPPLRVIVP